MPQKPTEIREWSNQPTSLITEPADSYKRLGFPVSQPPVNFFNWILNNIYKWIDFFNENLSGSGFIFHTHQTARPRIQVPFTLPETNKVASIQVLKREEGSVGGVSNTAYSGSGTVVAGVAGSQALTFMGGQTISYDYFNSGSDETFTYSRKDLSRAEARTLNGSSVIRTFGGDVFESDDRAGGLRLETNINTTSGNLLLISPTENVSGGTDSLWRDVVTRNQVYLIMGVSDQGIADGNAIVWDLSAVSSFPLEAGPYLVNVAPVYKNIDIDTNLSVYRVVKSYANVITGGTGSMIGTAINLDNSSPFNLASYAYNPSSQTITVTLSGTVSASAFHTLVIRQGGQDIISLLASVASYNSTDLSFTWSGINTDPLLSGGTTTFVFQTSGSGLPAYNFVVVSTGLSVETYGSNDYLHIESGSGVLNNDIVLIRKVGS